METESNIRVMALINNWEICWDSIVESDPFFEKHVDTLLKRGILNELYGTDDSARDLESIKIAICILHICFENNQIKEIVPDWDNVLIPHIVNMLEKMVDKHMFHIPVGDYFRACIFHFMLSYYRITRNKTESLMKLSEQLSLTFEEYNALASWPSILSHLTPH